MYSIFCMCPFSTLLHLSGQPRKLHCMDCLNGQPCPHLGGQLVSEVALSAQVLLSSLCSSTKGHSFHPLPSPHGCLLWLQKVLPSLLLPYHRLQVVMASHSCLPWGMYFSLFAFLNAVRTLINSHHFVKLSSVNQFEYAICFLMGS